MRESGGRSVLGGTDAEMLTNALAKGFVDARDAGFTVQFDEGIAFSHYLKFALDHGLVANEGPIQIVRKGHVSARFPVADGLGLFEFASEGGFRANVEPESEIGAEGHGVKAGEVVPIDATDDAARDESENE